MKTLETATLAAGCFWCVEAVFDDLAGVEDVISGYSGGHLENPTYQEVCQDTTGHAEVVEIKFDPAILSFRDLLHVFFAIHDPTTLNRQGNDIGTSYRSAIFYHSEEQFRIAQDVIANLNQQNIWEKPIVTELTPFTNFYAAETYHQEYFSNNPFQPYCAGVVAPKVKKFRKMFIDRLKKQA